MGRGALLFTGTLVVGCSGGTLPLDPSDGTHRLELTTAATSGIQGLPLAPVSVNVVRPSAETEPVTISIFARAPGATDAEQLLDARPTQSEVARFTTLRLTAGTYELVARAPGYLEARSGPLVVSASLAALRFAVEPSNAHVGQPIAPAVEVEIVDAAGARVPADDIPVDLLWLGGGGRSTSERTVAGLARFPEVIGDVVKSGAVIEAHSDGLISASSRSFDLLPKLPASLVWVVPPPTDVYEQRSILCSVVAVDEDGAPAAGLDLRFDVTLAEGEGHLEGESLVTQDGTASFERVRYFFAPPPPASEPIRIQVSVGPLALLSDPIAVVTSPPTLHRLTCPGGGEPAFGETYGNISGDGQWLSFMATCPGRSGLFLVEAATGESRYLGHDGGGSLSEDGRAMSSVTNGVEYFMPDLNGGDDDILWRDLTTGAVELMSELPNGAQRDASSLYFDGLSADGQRLVYAAAENRFGGGAPSYFLKVRGQPPVEIAAAHQRSLPAPINAAISADGLWVAFSSTLTLAPSDTDFADDYYLYDVALGAITLVARGPTNPVGVRREGPWLDGTGQKLLFSSDASDLVPNDTNDAWDVFLADTTTGVIERVSVDVTLDGATVRPLIACSTPDSHAAGISNDGRFVLFTSCADNLAGDDYNGEPDVFVKDRQTAQVVRLSIDPQNEDLLGKSTAIAISGDGRRVLLATEARNTGAIDTNNSVDLYWVDNPLAR